MTEQDQSRRNEVATEFRAHGDEVGGQAAGFSLLLRTGGKTAA